MSGSFGSEDYGDNIEFTANAINDYTIWLSMSGTDTETTKFPNNPQSARKFTIRTDKNASLVSLDNRIFTNPIKIVANKTHVERRNVPTIVKMVIRTTATVTKIKVRWF